MGFHPCDKGRIEKKHYFTSLKNQLLEKIYKYYKYTNITNIQISFLLSVFIYSDCASTWLSFKLVINISSYFTHLNYNQRQRNPCESAGQCKLKGHVIKRKFSSCHSNINYDDTSSGNMINDCTVYQIPTLASVPSTQYPAIMTPFLLSVHQLSNSSLDRPLCIIPGEASTTDGPMSSKCSMLYTQTITQSIQANCKVSNSSQGM